MRRESFIISRSYYEPMKKLEKDERGQLLDAICEYALNGVEPKDLSPIASMAFDFIGPGIERDYLTYETRAGQSRENGRLGGRPPKKLEEPNNPLGLKDNFENNPETLSVSVSDSVSVSVSDNKEEKKEKKKTSVFIPPSFEEFKNYFLENRFSKELAERAYRGYDVAGWKDSTGNQIRNWKQKCQHVWFKPENKQLNGKTILLESQPFKQLERW